MRSRRTLAACAVALALAAGVRAQGAGKATSPELPAGLQPVFEQGVQALKAGRLGEAEAAFQAVLAKGGKAAYVYNNLGIVAQQRGDHEVAVARFREAARLDPAYAAPRILLGASLVSLGRLGEARAPLETAVKLAPKEPLARMQLARLEEHAGRWAAAVAQYHAARNLTPDDPESVYALGNAYLRLSEWCLGELRAVPGGAARLNQALGHNYRVQGRPDLALAAFDRAAKADPSLPEVHLAMAQVHLEQGRLADARREVELELQLLPESAGARALSQRILALETGAP